MLLVRQGPSRESAGWVVACTAIIPGLRQKWGHFLSKNGILEADGGKEKTHPGLGSKGWGNAFDIAALVL
jgi:hypothetical protein